VRLLEKLPSRDSGGVGCLYRGKGTQVQKTFGDADWLRSKNQVVGLCWGRADSALHAQRQFVPRPLAQQPT